MLDLVVTRSTLVGGQALGHNFGIRWRNSTAATLAGLLAIGCAVVHAAVGTAAGLLLVVAGLLDVNICNAATATAVFVILGYSFVFVGRFGMFGNDVPGVKKAGNEAEKAEEDIDERIGAADAALDPDYFDIR